MLVGYVRVSTDLSIGALQIDTLNAAGCERMFEEVDERHPSGSPTACRRLGIRPRV